MSDKKDEKNAKSASSPANAQLSAVSAPAKESQPAPIYPNEVYANIQSKLASAQTANPVAAHWQRAVKPRFEIELYEEVTSDETGEITGYKKVPSEHPIIIEAANTQDLAEHAARYKFCHQKMKIIRKIDDGQPSAPISPQVPQAVQQPPTQSAVTVSAQASQPKQKPKYYKIGDIDIKDDNGKIYQKQWMKLSESEMSNLRVINDKNNSIVNLNGKHIEMKKWILVEKTDDEVSSLEEGLS